MPDSYRKLFLLMVLALLAMLVWGMFDEERLPQKRPEPPQAAYYFRDFQLHVTGSDGRLDYILRGERLVHYRQTGVSLVNQPRWTIYMPKGAPWYGRADNARVSAGGSEVHLQGDVRFHRPATSTNPAITLQTQRLHLRPREGYAETNRPVTVYGHDFHLNATGARAWLHEQRIELLAEVKGYYETAGH